MNMEKLGENFHTFFTFKNFHNSAIKKISISHI
jgi:hypothetical protein